MTLDSIISILTIFEFIFCLVCKSLLFVSIWYKKGELLTILNSSTYDPYLKSLNKEKWNYSVPFISAWLIVYVISAISRLCSTPSQGIDAILPQSNITVGSFSTWYTFLKIEAKYSILWELLFLSKNDNDETIFEVVIIVIIGISYFFKSVMAFFADISILIFVLTLRTPVKEFASQLKRKSMELVSEENTKVKEIPIPQKRISWIITEASRAQIELVVKQYESLKALSVLVNSFIGPTLLFYFGETVFTYGLHFKYSIYQGPYVMKAVLALFYLCLVCIFCFSSDIPRQVCV